MSSDPDRNDSGRAYTSAFDELLERNRQEFDALYARSGAAPIERLLEERSGSPTRPVVSPGSAPSRPPASTLSRHDAWAAVRESAEARSLRARFADNWHFDVTQRQRDGDQVIVLGKLTLKGKDFGKDVVKAQFGHAAIHGSGASSSAEEHAFAQASQVALARCAALT